MTINCRNLEAEMKRRSISREDLAETLNLSYSTIHSRINGTSQWLYKECVILQQTFFQDCELGYLFEIVKQTLVR